MHHTRAPLSLYMIGLSFSLVSAARADLRLEVRELADLSASGDLAALRQRAQKPGPVQDLFRLHAARVAHRAGSLEEALALLEDFPQGPAQARARSLEALVLAGLGRRQDPSAPDAPRYGAEDPGQRALDQAQALRSSGDHAAADQALLDLARKRPRTGPARQAVRTLYTRYRAGAYVPVPSPPARLLEFGQALFDHRYTPHAVDMAKRVVNSPSISTPHEQARGWFLLGKVYERKKNRWYAARCFADAARLAGKDSALRAEAYYRRGQAFLQLDQKAQAEAAFAEAVKAGGSYAAAATWQAALIDLRAGRTAQGHASLARLARTWPRSWFAPKALWRIALDRSEGEDPQAAKDAWLAFVAAFPKNRLANAARFHAAEQARRGKAVRTARKLWRECLDTPVVPGLYSLLAAQRLEGQAPSFERRHGPGWQRFLSRYPPTARQTLAWLGGPPSVPREASARVEALWGVQLYEDVAGDLAYWIEGPAASDLVARAGLGAALHAVQRHRDAIGLFESIQRGSADLVGEDRGILLTGLFTRGHVDAIEHGAARWEVPPPLVFAVAREESHFAAKLQSWSDARGLMQVLPSTGRWIAEKTGGRGLPDLYDPRVAARFGSWYLRHLLDKFADHPQPTLVAIASYNGGPGYMGRWLRRHEGRDFLDVLTRIDRDETRNYVHKVTRSLLAFEALAAREAARHQPPLVLETLRPGDPPAQRRSQVLPGAAGYGGGD